MSFRQSPSKTMKPYSIALRQKIIETYENEVISQRQLAKRFRVAFSFVIKILKQYRETGDPGKSSGRFLLNTTGKAQSFSRIK